MPDTEQAGPFLARWSERKQAARKGERPPAEPREGSDQGAEAAAAPRAEPAPLPELGPAREPVPKPAPAPILTDADMPPLETLDGHSDYSGFLSRGVSPTLRREAFSRLFHSPHLNVTDGLDDFAEDFTRFAPLGDLITADRRHQLDLAARRLLEQDTEAAPAAQTHIAVPSRDGGDPSENRRRGAEPPNDRVAAVSQEDAGSSHGPAPPSPAEPA